MSDFPPTFTLRSPEDLLGMVPYLLGFQPADSAVALFIGYDRRMWLASRLDLDTPLPVAVDTLTGVAARGDTARVVIIGYGPRSAASWLTALADALGAHVTEVDVYRVG